MHPHDGHTFRSLMTELSLTQNRKSLQRNHFVTIFITFLEVPGDGETSQNDSNL